MIFNTGLRLLKDITLRVACKANYAWRAERPVTVCVKGVYCPLVGHSCSYKHVFSWYLFILTSL